MATSVTGRDASQGGGVPTDKGSPRSKSREKAWAFSWLPLSPRRSRSPLPGLGKAWAERQ